MFIPESRVEDTKNTALVEVSWGEIVVKSRIKLQTFRIKIQTQTKKPQICFKMFFSQCSVFVFITEIIWQTFDKITDNQYLTE